MNPIKQFSEVLLKDGIVGTVMDVYTEPCLGYDVDVADPDPEALLPDEPMRTVFPDEIEEILWEPTD